MTLLKMNAAEYDALSMSGSTLVVAINALLLKRTKLTGIRQLKKNIASKIPAAGTPISSEV